MIIRDLLIDSRLLIHPDHCLFVALASERNDGHRYIGELYEKGVRAFLVSEKWMDRPGTSDEGRKTEDPCVWSGAVFITVEDTLEALQALGAWHRGRFAYPVIGITGSNGKTIVKEWLFQLLGSHRRIIRSPKSYNSQVGVPLSVWRMDETHEMALFEAGISRPGEMEKLEKIIRPGIGIFTNIGPAHDEFFENRRQKVQEKLKLFANAKVLVYCADHPLVSECLRDPAYAGLRTFTWGRGNDANLMIGDIDRKGGQSEITASCDSNEIRITIPFTDDASIENAIHCLAAIIVLEMPQPLAPAGEWERITRYTNAFASLVPIAMRLELNEAVNHCSLINDSYNSDVNSLSIALDFLNQQNQHLKKTVILSDILQSGREKSELYRDIAAMMETRGISRIIGIGRDMVKYGGVFPMSKAFFATTDEFLRHFPVSSFRDETILVKGARLFEFEKIIQVLQQKAHETVMEINLDALVHNLNHYRATLPAGTKTMAMVKAFSYGSGSFEIANELQFHRVDYLAVAYADEGVELRKAGIRLPVMVMSPEEQSLDILLKYNLEPEIYNLHILRLLEETIARNQTSILQEVRIHIKLDTGMHRLGFSEEELAPLLERLTANPALRVQSVFSHLAASEDPSEDDFSSHQIARFRTMSDRIREVLDYPVLLHILNSAGITRFPEARFDMVRLGIGLYGVGSSPAEQAMLRNVSTLKSVITQIKRIPAGDTIGYNRKGKAEHDMVLAVVPVGYADGLDRRLSNGRGRMYVNGRPAPIIGNICMDLTMIDITHPPAPSLPAGRGGRRPGWVLPDIREGDEVVIFGDRHPVGEMAEAIGTIPYEVLTGISRRVKRIYFHE